MLLDVNVKAAQIEQLTQHTFENKLLAAEAVQMAAPKVMASSTMLLQGLSNNKRLSILGDVVLTKILCGLWFNARKKHGKCGPPISYTHYSHHQGMSLTQATGPRCAMIC